MPFPSDVARESTFTDRSRAISLSARSKRAAAATARRCGSTEARRAGRLVDRQVAIGAMWIDLLTRLEVELSAVKMDRDEAGSNDTRLEMRVLQRRRHGTTRPADALLTHGVITADPFVWAEGLELHRSEAE